MVATAKMGGGAAAGLLSHMDDVPAFARPTASRIALVVSREPSTEMMTDTHAVEAKVATALRAYERTVQADKLEHPQRYSSLRRTSLSGSGPASPGSPSRTLASAAGTTATLAASPAAVIHMPAAGGAGGGGGVAVRSVTVRAVEGDEATVARLRASREMARSSRGSAATGAGGAMTVEPPAAAAAAAGSSDSGTSGGSGGVVVPPLSGRQTAASPSAAGVGAPSGTPLTAASLATLGPGKVLEILNGCVLEGLSGNVVLRKFDAGRPPAFSFVDLAALRHELDDGQVVAVLRSVGKVAGSLATACLLSPRGFYHLASFLLPLLTHLADSSAGFLAAAGLLRTVGTSMNAAPTAGRSTLAGEESVAVGYRKAAATAGSETVAAALLRDFLLPPLADVLRRKPAKRPALIPAILAYAAPPSAPDTTPVINLVHTLQEALGDADAFLQCIALVALHDPRDDVRVCACVFINATIVLISPTPIYPTHPLQEQLVDLVAYYASLGLGSESPRTRAAALAIYSRLFGRFPQVVLRQFGRFADMKDDTWWEVRMQLTLLACRTLALVADHGHSVLAAAEAAAAAAAAGEGKEGESKSDGDGDGVTAAAAALGMVPDDLDAAVALALEVLTAIVLHDPQTDVLRAFITSAAPLLAAFAQLLPLFIHAISTLPPATRDIVVGVTAGGQVAPEGALGRDAPVLRSALGINYPPAAIVADLPPLEITLATADVVRRHSLEELDMGQLQLLVLALLHACGVRGTAATAAAAAAAAAGAPLAPPADATLRVQGLALRPVSSDFLPAFKALQDHIFVALADPRASAIASLLLEIVIVVVPGAVSFLTSPAVLGSLVLLFRPPVGDRDPAAEATVVGMLTSLARRGHPFDRAVSDAVIAFAKRDPALYDASGLAAVPIKPA